MAELIRMTIKMDDTGGIQVEGPLDNKVFAYGMLEVARDIIAKRPDNPSGLVAPPAGFAEAMKR